MISEEKVEGAVEYLRLQAGEAAEAKANHIYMDEYRKVVKATLMREKIEDTLGSQESYAYSHMRYKEHLEVLKEAIKADEFHRWKMKAAEAVIETWRTQQANERALGKLG